MEDAQKARSAVAVRENAQSARCSAGGSCRERRARGADDDGTVGERRAEGGEASRVLIAAPARSGTMRFGC